MRQKKLCSFFYQQSHARNPLKKRSDHSFYHRQTRNTRKQWTKNARGASVLERKRHESTQSAREDRPTSVGVVEAAGSSPVTQTKKPSGFVQNTQIRRLFLIKNDLFLLLLHNRIGFASKSEFCLAFLLRIFYEFIPEFSPNALRKTSECASFLAFFYGFEPGNFHRAPAYLCSLYGN